MLIGYTDNSLDQTALGCVLGVLASENGSGGAEIQAGRKGGGGG